MKIKALKEAIDKFPDDFDVMFVTKSDDIMDEDELVWLELDMLIEVRQGKKTTIAFCNNSNIGITPKPTI